MKSRSLTIAMLAVAGVVAGPFFLRIFPDGQLTLPWFSHVIVIIGSAVGIPFLLGSIGTNGNYKTVARLWAGLGALAILLVASGTSSAALSLRSASVSELSLLVLSTGLGLFVGLGIVKLAIHQARAKNGA